MGTVSLTCPHCGGRFDYEYIPGVSVSAVRLGWKRYMKCPLCSRWGTFDLRRSAQPTGALSPESPPTYSDRRLFVRRSGWVIGPILVVLLSLIWASAYPVAVFWIDIAMVLVLVIGMVVLLTTSRPPRTA